MTREAGPDSIVYEQAAAMPQDVVHLRRSSLAFLSALVREPLSVIPAQSFTHGLVATRALGRQRVYLTSPALVQDVFVGHSDRLSKGVAGEVMKPALGTGLLTAEEADWRWQRRALAPGFASARLERLLPAMIAAAADLRDRLASLPPGTAIDIGREASRVTLRIVGDTMLACAGELDPARVERGIAAFLRPIPWALAMSILGAPSSMPFPGRRHSLAAAQELRAEVGRAVATRRADGGADEADDLMALLLAARDPDSGRALTDAEITDNVVTFVTAGHDTTSVALTWALWLLADHPEVVAAMRAEIAVVAGSAPLTAAHVPQLAFAKQVVHETMRLYPPAPVTSRDVVEPFDIGGLHLAAGAAVVLPIYAIHRHGALWDEPERFDPARFAPDRAKARHRYAFLPFGLGPRVCIGNAFAILEATAILAVLVRALDFEPTGLAPIPTARLTLRPRRPVMLKVRSAGRSL